MSTPAPAGLPAPASDMPLGRRAVGVATTLLLLATLGIVLFTVLRLPLKDDLAWLLYVARRWLAGRELYVDVVEVNPPLIIWLSAVPIRLAGWLETSPELVAVPFFLSIVLGCAWWASTLLRGAGALFAERLPVFAVLGTVLLAVPGVEVGQREHLLVAAALPFLVLFTAGLEGRETRLPISIAAGILAGLGCALKPRYAAVFMSLETLALLQARPILRWRPHPGTVAAGATLLAYGVVVYFFCPAFVRRAVPLALALYGATDVPLSDLLWEMARLIAAQGVVAALIWVGRRRVPDNRLALVLLVFAATSTVVCLMDGKNWFYHRLPATVATVLALLCWAASVIYHRTRWPRIWLPLMLAGAGLGVFTIASVQRLEPEVEQAVTPEQTTVARLETLIREQKVKRYIAFSEWIALGFPVVNNTGVAWASRFDSMWALKGELWRARFDPAADKEWPIRQWIAQDFVTGCPDLAVVDRREGVNYIGVLSASEPSFARAWSHYHVIDSFDGLDVYRRDAAGCTDPAPAPILTAKSVHPPATPGARIPHGRTRWTG